MRRISFIIFLLAFLTLGMGANARGQDTGLFFFDTFFGGSDPLPRSSAVPSTLSNSNKAGVTSGIFSSSIKSTRQTVSPSVLAARPLLTIDILQRNLGVNSPQQLVQNYNWSVGYKGFFSSPEWQNYRSDIYATLGNSPETDLWFRGQERLFGRYLRINNQAFGRSSLIKGEVGESIMNRFYTKDGWEIFNGKRGTNGFDGLYVRRHNGVISDWLAVEAKTDRASLQMTQHGRQMSPEWIRHNLDELLDMAKKEYSRNPTLANEQRIADLEQIMRLPGRTPRMFRATICVNDGKTFFELKNLDVNEQIIGKPMMVDMQCDIRLLPKKFQAIRNAYYQDLRTEIAKVSPSNAQAITDKMRMAFESGRIKNGRDWTRVLARELRDEKMSKEIARRMGIEENKTLARTKVNDAIYNYSGVIVSAAMVAGFVIAQDAMANGITKYTFVKAGAVAGATTAVALTVNYGINKAVQITSEQLARRSLEQAGKKITEKAVAKEAQRLAPMLGKAVGGGIQVFTGVIFVGKAWWDYEHNTITRQDLAVETGIITITTAAGLWVTIATTTAAGAKAGAATGTAITPGWGTFIGCVIGLVGGAASGGYMYYVSSERRERLEREQANRAEWETFHSRERLSKRISELQESYDEKLQLAWGQLL